MIVLGTAFFPLQSCMNHSCRPNAKAFKREEVCKPEVVYVKKCHGYIFTNFYVCNSKMLESMFLHFVALSNAGQRWPSNDNCIETYLQGRRGGLFE